MSDALRLIYVVAADAEEARSLGRGLVEAGLVACANVLPQMESICRWEGELQQSSEAVLLLKTTASRAVEVVAWVERKHSYDCPCVLVLEVERANAGFAQWLREVVAPETSK